MQLPSTITRLFSFGNRLSAATAAANLSVPIVWGLPTGEVIGNLLAIESLWNVVWLLSTSSISDEWLITEDKIDFSTLFCLTKASISAIESVSRRLL